MTSRTRDLQDKIELIDDLLSNIPGSEGSYMLDSKKIGPRRQYCLHIFTGRKGDVVPVTGWLMLNEMRYHLDGMLRGICTMRNKFSQ